MPGSLRRASAWGAPVPPRTAWVGDSTAGRTRRRTSGSAASCRRRPPAAPPGRLLPRRAAVRPQPATRAARVAPRDAGQGRVDRREHVDGGDQLLAVRADGGVHRQVARRIAVAVASPATRRSADADPWSTRFLPRARQASTRRGPTARAATWSMRSASAPPGTAASRQLAHPATAAAARYSRRRPLQRPLRAGQVSVEDGGDVGNREALHDAGDQRRPPLERHAPRARRWPAGAAPISTSARWRSAGVRCRLCGYAPQLLQHPPPQPCRRPFGMAQLRGALRAGCHGRRCGLGGARPVSERDQQREAMKPRGMQIPECRAQQVRLAQVDGHGRRGRGRLLRWGLGRQGVGSGLA